MSALPKTSSPQVQEITKGDHLSAYEACLQYEESATNSDQLRHVRILGFLLLNVPNEGIRSEVARCIHSYKADAGLFDFGEFIEHYIFVPFKKYKGRKPEPSDYPSRFSFGVVKDMTKVNIKEAPKNHQDAKDRALIRDNWRCPVTGLVHLGAPADVFAQLGAEEMAVFTECAHIIPEATFFGVNPKTKDNRQLDYSASVLAVLQRFRYDISTFNGEKVHSLTNVITMEKNIHDLFDRLLLYFEPTIQDDRYKVKSCTGFRIPNMRDFVTFATDNPEHLLVPSPELLALHATCCKVAHLSGASEHIDRVYHDAERIGVLSGDGTSGDMLSYALLSVSNLTGDD